MLGSGSAKDELWAQQEAGSEKPFAAVGRYGFFSRAPSAIHVFTHPSREVMGVK